MRVSRTRSRGMRVLPQVRPDRVLEAIGHSVVKRCVAVISILSLLSATCVLAFTPKSWSEPVRSVMSRQLLFTGVDGTWAAARFGAAVGVLLIVQAALWVDAIGMTTEMIAPMLWRAIVREVAPLLACLVVIGRSGVAISTELATMRVDGQLEVLDAQGIDPMTSLGDASNCQHGIQRFLSSTDFSNGNDTNRLRRWPGCWGDPRFFSQFLRSVSRGDSHSGFLVLCSKNHCGWSLRSGNLLFGWFERQSCYH